MESFNNPQALAAWQHRWGNVGTLQSKRTLLADIVILGGGLGGVAAALAACRSGRTVLMTEPTDWIGGQLTQQGVPPDEHPWIEKFGCTASYRQFRNGVRDYYRRHYPLTEAARANAWLNPGNGFVSSLCHEPRVALAVLEEMLAPHRSSGRLQILHHTEPVRAEVTGDRIHAVTVRDAAGDETVLLGRMFLDATELGDLLELAGVEHVTGFESCRETGEPHAPEVAQPLNQQAFTMCFAMEYRPGENHVIPKPADYDFWQRYVPPMTPAWPGKLFSWWHSHHHTLEPVEYGLDPEREPRGEYKGGWLYRRIADRGNFLPGSYPSDICLVNWALNDYILGPLVGVTKQEAAEHVRRARQLSLSLLYWLQTESPRPDGSAGWPGLRLRPDILGTADGLAKHPYIRESRRIRALFTVLEQHISMAERKALAERTGGTPRAEVFADSVGIGSYHMDLHFSTGGNNYIALPALPFQIPLGALIPVRLENLLPACKNLGTTHLTNGAYRLHPVEWNIGEVAGTLAARSLDLGLPPRAIRENAERLLAFQQELERAGVELAWPRI